MTRSTARRTTRSRGRIEVLPSGSLRVIVFCGRDPLTKRRLYQRELIPAGPTAQAEAEKALRRMVVEIDEERNPRTAATVAQLLERHFELLEIEPKTLITYRSLAERHIVPLLGKVKVGGSCARTCSTRSMRSCVVVAPTATAVRTSTTAARLSMSATSGAGCTRAARYRGRQSGRSTSSSAAL